MLRLTPFQSTSCPIDSLVLNEPTLNGFMRLFYAKPTPSLPRSLFFSSLSGRPMINDRCVLLLPSFPPFIIRSPSSRRRAHARQLLESDGKATSFRKSQPMWKIGRQDVANLLVAAMAHKKAARSTLTCSWGKDKKREG